VPNDLYSTRRDAAYISQVIQNLVLNALEATDEGDRIEIGAENIVLADGEINDLPAGEYVRIAVGDTGIGIPPENLDRIFAPFLSTCDDTTGLGLAMVKTIIEKHAGDVTVESTEGRDAIFSLYIPAVEESSDKKDGEGLSIKFGASRILVMDDDQDIVSSGYNTDETEADYLAKGFTGVLSKPYRSADLDRILKVVLG